MIRAAVISDTHNMLRPQMLEVLRTCGCIIHAGDFSYPEVLDKLREYGPVYAVQGNNDYDWPEPLPKKLSFELEGVKFTMIHNRAWLLTDFTDANVIIYGHTHKYSEMEAAGRLWLNPGSCGRKRGERPATMAVMEIDNGTYNVQQIVLED